MFLFIQLDCLPPENPGLQVVKRAQVHWGPRLGRAFIFDTYLLTPHDPSLWVIDNLGYTVLIKLIVYWGKQKSDKYSKSQ